MCDAIKDYTPSGKIKRPSYSLVAKWVKEGWDAVDVNKIRQSFKCCGISNAMDGTEDTLIFDFNRLENKVNREDLGREIDFEREDNESDDEDSDYNESESESELEDSDETELEDSDKSELEDNYYEENEEQNVIQDWN